MKKLVISAVIGIFIACVVQIWIDRHIEADLCFFGQDVADVKDTWYKTVAGRSEKIHIIAGGSEIATSLDPDSIKDAYGITVMNAGYHAGFGLPPILAVASSYIRPGDHFVCSLYPSAQALQMGMKFAFMRLGSGVLRSPVMPVSEADVLKIITGNLLLSCCHLDYAWSRYKYSIPHLHYYEIPENGKLHDSGFLEIKLRTMEQKKSPPTAYLEGPMETYLQKTLHISQYCDKVGADFSVLLPPLHNDSPAYRLRHAKIALMLVEHGIRVLKDERLGICTDVTMFADTVAHLSSQGVQKNTEIWGKALKEGSFWTKEELQHVIEEYELSGRADIL